MIRAWLVCAAALSACGYPKLAGLASDASGPDPDAPGIDAPGPDAGPPSSAKDLTQLAFLASDNPSLDADVAATIQGTVATARVPLGANQSLVASFETTGDHVEVNGVRQQSGVTADDFYGPLTYRVVAADGTSQDYVVTVTAPAAQQAYVKASTTYSSAFGWHLALSADGTTLAVSAIGDPSLAAGIDGDQQNQDGESVGAVYVFTRAGTTWSQQAYIKASNPDSDDFFGSSVALSSDGNTLAVGASGEASAATGINGDEGNTDVPNTGAAYVFTRAGTTWSQQAYVKASNTSTPDELPDVFGHVALSGDGNTLAVSADHEDSAATGIDGDQADNSALDSGAVYVFTRAGATWSQQAYVKASNTGSGDDFGIDLALSADGDTLAVGAYDEDSAATGIGGDQADNTATNAGAVYVFTRSGATWSQQAYVKASNTGAGDGFGYRVALSDDGNTLAVAANGEDSAAIGIGGDQADNTASNAGAVYVFTRSGATWSQQAYVKASNTGAGDAFGFSVALSSDGNALAVGADGEDSAATGIDGDQADNTASIAGAAYVFTRSGAAWVQQAYVKASNAEANDNFGDGVALSRDGTTLAVGAPGEDSAATGIDGNQADNTASGAGAVYVFR